MVGYFKGMNSKVTQGSCRNGEGLFTRASYDVTHKFGSSKAGIWRSNPDIHGKSCADRSLMNRYSIGLYNYLGDWGSD